MKRLSMLLVAMAMIAAPAAEADAAAGYVALGDSFSAGPLIPFPAGPLGCLRSDANYPHLVASRLTRLSFHDATCSGAETWDMTHPQDVSPGGPVRPQLDSVGPRTRIVSLTIGGNDAGFSSVFAGCVTFDPFDPPCRRHYVSGGRDELSRRISSIAPLVGRVLRAVRARAPRARVFLLNYPAVFAERGRGCWPRQPFALADVPYLRAKGRELNRMLARVAAAGSATLVDWYSASIGHDPCKAAPLRWVEPLLPGSLAAPVHPNARGMRAAAGLLLDAIRRPRQGRAPRPAGSAQP
jgi:lysophospholipase L1-like esterase